MCGRYNLITDGQALVDFFEVEISLMDIAQVQARYNIAPSQSVPAVRQGERGRELLALRWGLVPAWSKEPRTNYSMINARADSVASKPAYRSAFRQRRCLIPATGFYEWSGTAGNKQPWFIGMQDRGLFAFAGIWEHWQDNAQNSLDSCSIIVTEANELVRTVHDRMPVILHREDYARWLDPRNSDTAALQSLLQPYTGQQMAAYPVSRLVNNASNEDAGCIERADR